MRQIGFFRLNDLTYREHHIVCTVQASQEKDSSCLSGVPLPLQHLTSNPVS
jgi:hypothetical protein